MDFRCALEVYLIGSDDKDVMEDAMGKICSDFPSDLAKGWEENTENIDVRVLQRAGRFQPDFIDDNGVKRLRIKTLIEITGLPAHDIIALSSKDLDPRFVDAMDFISLNKQKFMNGSAEDKKIFIEAHSAMVDYGPPEVAKMFTDKFKEVFGEIPFDYVDAEGEGLITAERLAEFLGVSMEEVNEGFDDAVRLGHARVVPAMPDPENGNVH